VHLFVSVPGALAFWAARRADVAAGSVVGYIDRMPLYEYRCGDCRKRVTVLTLRASEQVDAACDRCGSRKLERMMSRFAMVRSEESRLDALSDPSQFGDLDDSDPKSMAKWMRRMGREMGDEIGGPELDEMVDNIEAGADDDGGGDDGESGSHDD
jgi:putative FmdB family regulatory protein